MTSIIGQGQLQGTTTAQAKRAVHRGNPIAIHRESGARRAFRSFLATWRRGAELSRAIDAAKDTAWQAPDGPSHRLLG